MIETRPSQAVLHVQFRHNPLAPCRPDVVFRIHDIAAEMPFEMARGFASTLMTELIILEHILQDDKEGPREPATARLRRWMQRWAR